MLYSCGHPAGRAIILYAESVTARLRYRPSRVQQHSAGGVRAFNAGSCVGSRSDRTSLELGLIDSILLSVSGDHQSTMHAPSSLQPAGTHARPSIRPADHIAARHSSIGADRCIAYCMHGRPLKLAASVLRRISSAWIPLPSSHARTVSPASSCRRTKPLPDPDPDATHAVAVRYLLLPPCVLISLVRAHTSIYLASGYGALPHTETKRRAVLASTVVPMP